MPVMMNAYKFRMYPNKAQTAILEETLEICRRLWNTALADRKNTYKETGVGRTYNQQAAILTIEKKENPELKTVFSQVLQNVLKRVDIGTAAFFKRLREGAKKPGFPRFKREGQYKSFTYPGSGFEIEDDHLILSKIGTIRIFKHREIEGQIKTCTITRDRTGCWYCSLVTELEDVPKIIPETAIGVDVGLKHMAAISNGEYIEYPKYYYQSEERLGQSQKEMSRKKKGSINRNKARTKVARIHKHIANQRADFSQKASRKLVDMADVVVFEDLQIQNMLKNHHLAKSISDHAWGMLIRNTISKAESAGKIVVLVNPYNTSQRCSNCGAKVPKDISARVHTCPRCGLVMCRDRNAALVILADGLSVSAYRDMASTLGEPLQQATSMK
jgi:putative transposase